MHQLAKHLIDLNKNNKDYLLNQKETTLELEQNERILNEVLYYSTIRALLYCIGE